MNDIIIGETKRAPLSETNISGTAGDEAFDSWQEALDAALWRTGPRSSRQQVRNARDIGGELSKFWLVQDVR